MHDGETIRAWGGPRLAAAIRKSAIRKRLSAAGLLGLLGDLVTHCGVFVYSRRWLIGSLLISGLLLALVIVARPTAHFSASAPVDPETMFDEVKSFPLRPPSNSGAAPAGGALDKTAAREERMALSLRLEAVRSGSARGAWLTGKIDAGVPEHSALKTPDTIRQ